MAKKTEINITVELDENNLPIKMQWSSSDSKEQGSVKGMLLSLWDEKEKNSMHLHLWTKDMMTDEMKQFMHQTLLGESDTIKRALGDEKLAASLYDYSHEFALQAGILKNAK
ncbi:MAG TPA: gliding motility protein GldC [Bacteroidia bacterium]|nr:gliding motility protein GldC [Bacteroidia bacterium]